MIMKSNDMIHCSIEILNSKSLENLREKIDENIFLKTKKTGFYKNIKK